MSDRADAVGFYVAYPDGIDQHWNVLPGSRGNGDLQFVRDLIADLTASCPIDQHRIFATGISNGGGMVNRLACDLSDLLAAIAPVAGSYNSWQECDPTRPIPIVAFHGHDDQVAPYEGAGRGNVQPPIRGWAAAWAERNGCSRTPEVESPAPRVTVEQWNDCDADSTVILISIDGHGHSWPGTTYLPDAITSHEVDATDVMLRFFQNYRLP